MKIFFDLDAEEKYHRIEWERMLDEASAGNSAACAIVHDRSSSDIVILSKEPPFPFLKKISPLSRQDISTFVWDHSDHPVGRMSGLYCSLPRPRFDGKRHHTFCYPITYNELIESFPLSDARYDYGFMGGITAPLRKKIVRHLSAETRLNGFVKIQGGPWDRMFDRTGVAAKADYAENIRRSKFVICPRGNGVGSVRLFEVMKAKRVPVIISDQYVLPSQVDWKSCSLNIRERDIDKIIDKITLSLPIWETLAANARHAWERSFSTRTLIVQLRQKICETNIEDNVAVSRQLYYVMRQLQHLSLKKIKEIVRTI